jgi:plasmid maintenance system killer protein
LGTSGSPHPFAVGRCPKSQGRFSELVSRNWRITFAFEGENAIDIDMEDYHG